MLEDLIREIKEKEIQYRELGAVIQALNIKLKKYREEKGEYETDFTPYIGKDIKEITLIVQRDTFVRHDTYYDSINIDESGHISALEWGEMSHCGIKWDNENSRYCIDSCFDSDGNPLTLIGFYNVVLEED